MEGMKRLGSLILLLLAVLTSAPAQLAKSLGAPNAYVDDYAHVLTSSGAAQIETLCKQIHDQTKAQVFLVTVPSLKGEDIAEFSNDLFHQWKIGEKGTDRGILVVFATGDHMHRIEVGYGFEGVLNDAKAGDIGRAITPDLHALHYDSAGLAAVTQLAAIITPGAVLDPSATPAAAPQQADPSADVFSTIFWIFFGGIALTIFGLSCWAAYSRHRGWNGIVTGGRSGVFGDDGSSSSSDFSSSSDSDFGGGDGGDSGGGGASGSD